MPQLAFHRILFKLSGEMLQKPGSHGIDAEATQMAAERIKEIADTGCEVAVIIGAGNLFRGLAGSKTGMDRTAADQIGMLATCMNAIAMRQALEGLGLKAEMQSALPIPGVLPPFDQRAAVKMLSEKTVVLFAAGTGHPYFTTDTCAALRGCEILADAVFKGTKVNGIYSADPMKHPDAVRYETLSFDQALAQHIAVMDSTAFSLCQDNQLPILVFKFGEAGILRNIMYGDLSAATLVK